MSRPLIDLAIVTVTPNAILVLFYWINDLYEKHLAKKSSALQVRTPVHCESLKSGTAGRFRI